MTRCPCSIRPFPHGAGAITAETTRQMLGLADRARIIDLFEALMKGDIAKALEELKSQYDIGAEPAVVLSDLADFVHLVTRLKLTPDANSDAAAHGGGKNQGPRFCVAPLCAGSLSCLANAAQGPCRGAILPAPSGHLLKMVLVRLCLCCGFAEPG